MRAFLIGLALLAAPALAQSKCQSRCMDNHCTEGCTDDKCMQRCSNKMQSCMESCEKTDPATTEVKKVKLNGSCPGPGGRLMPCDQIPQQGFDEASVKNAMANNKKKQPNHDKDNASVPHTMPTADNFQKLYEEHQKQMRQK